jgi:hypothetical protein
VATARRFVAVFVAALVWDLPALAFAALAPHPIML